MRTLGERFDPRHNTFDALRLLFAGSVAISHGIVLRTGHQPHLGEATIGDFGVDGFFVLSGFLIARSYLTVADLARFGWHRLLRILPGFWACLLLTALVIAPLGSVLAGRPAWALWRESAGYVAGNAGLLITRYEIGDLFAGQPTPLIVNGSLWTLALEAFCYLLLATFGLLGLLRRHRWTVPAFAAAAWLLLALQAYGAPVPVGDNVLRMTLMFTLGATGYLFADRIPTHPAVLAGAVLLAGWSAVALPNYRVLGAAAFCYVLLWLGSCLPTSVRLRTDLSYGLYIYHWPVFQLLAGTALVGLPVPLFVLVGGLVAVPVALLSWRLVERPALRRKDSPFPDRVWAAGRRLAGRAGFVTTSSRSRPHGPVAR